ncbi:DUF5805 domain-containing protein [Halorussus salilacus]|uniref:DUF5805 domain-containing protein n=1 Tax=Halorussus salilacus TaxID=2953750 RepID=UPI00209F434E|nr:DUF5805 domain-containing protein [Halorussus salilacus]USZ68429.1 DUF5805 domain-containing protein [Halorussus salilacus]
MSDADTDRAVVKTFVPTYQKEKWKRDADELDMTQSEFVKTMVQAGRRGFDLDDGPAASVEEGGSGGSNPRGDGLETRLLDLLRSEGHLSWDRLVEELAGDFEDRLEETLGRLQNENRVQYSGRRGGYTVVDDGE